MPYVIILTGHPCSGKSTLASLIRKRALDHPSHLIVRTVVLNEESACPDHTIASCYATSIAEKKTRGALKSAFDRAVASAAASTDSGETLIILDSSNYIKGYRYELFCISKDAGCSHSVVWCLNSVDAAREWNRARRERERERRRKNAVGANCEGADVFYSDELLNELILRYEPPDERNRWDKPLFRIDMTPMEESDIGKRQRGADAGRGVVNRSVYNMHNLAEAMGATEGTNSIISREAANMDVGIASTTSVATGKATSTLFKRSGGVKKRTVPNDSSRQQHTTALTADALASLPLSGPVTVDSSCLPTEPSAMLHIVPRTSPEDTSRLIEKDYPSVVCNDVPPKSLEQQVDAFLEQFLFCSQKLRQGTSTRQQAATIADGLHRIDVVTQQVCAYIQSVNSVWSGAMKEDNDANLLLPIWCWESSRSTFFESMQNVQYTTVELRRRRQQYMQWVAMHPPETHQHNGAYSQPDKVIARSFWEYLEASNLQQGTS